MMFCCACWGAAHNAPSVGLMQPWRFIVIRSQRVRASVHDIFSQAQLLAAGSYEGERGELYRGLSSRAFLRRRKIEGAPAIR